MCDALNHMCRILYNYIHKSALLRSNQLTSVADHGGKLPTTTLITSAYIGIWYMQSLCYILNAYSAAFHTLISLESIWRIVLIEP
jgi:hypothetical protein